MSATTAESNVTLPGRAGIIRRLARDKVAAGAAIIFGTICVVSALAPWVSPYDPYFTDLTKVMQPPNEVNWLGTDNTGRDILSRIIYGTRNTLLMGLAGVVLVVSSVAYWACWPRSTGAPTATSCGWSISCSRFPPS